MFGVVQKISDYVTDLLDRQLSKDFIFHNRTHTEEVVQAVILIGSQSGISKEDLELLQVAAWFHDSGYCFSYLGHENDSIAFARYFLKDLNCSPDFITETERLINATRFPQKPVSELEYIICDADLAHLAKSDYPHYEERLRREWQICLGKTYSDQEWLTLNLDLINNHHYFTLYAQNNFEAGKQKNAAQIAKALKAL